MKRLVLLLLFTTQSATAAEITDPELLERIKAARNPDAVKWDTDAVDPKPEKLGPGPHTLVISDGNGMTKVEYTSGPKCQKARDVVRLQTDARLTNKNPGVIYESPRVQAFCVPR